MKEKIDNLLEQLHKKEIDMIELRNQLLLLYNVSWRSEQLPCEHDYQADTTCGVDINCCTKCGDVI